MYKNISVVLIREGFIDSRKHKLISRYIILISNNTSNIVETTIKVYIEANITDLFNKLRSEINISIPTLKMITNVNRVVYTNITEKLNWVQDVDRRNN